MPPKRKNISASESESSDSYDEDDDFMQEKVREINKYDIDEKRQKVSGIEPTHLDMLVQSLPEDAISSPIKPRLILRQPPSDTLQKASLHYFNQAQCSTCKLFKPITEFLKVIIAIYRKIEYKLPRIQRTCDICRKASTQAFQKRKRRIAEERADKNVQSREWQRERSLQKEANKKITFARPIVAYKSSESESSSETESD